MRLARSLGLSCSLLAGCGAAPRAAVSSTPPGALSEAPSEPDAMVQSGELSDRLSGEEQELELALSSGADCARACEHLDTICELAERICALATKEAELEVGARCSDARARCAAARTRTNALCTCEP